MGTGITVIAYADDLAVVVSAKTIPLLQERTMYAVKKLRSMGLALAGEKIETVILAGKRNLTQVVLN